MSSVAFLQNQWFHNPARMRKLYEGVDLVFRCKMDAAYLFMGCLTGRRLMTAFGDEGRHGIVWANASPLIGGQSDASFPADPKHMQSIIDHFKPTVLLAFGKIAQAGLSGVSFDGETISGPHPTARHGTVCKELRLMADRWKLLMGAVHA